MISLLLNIGQLGMIYSLVVLGMFITSCIIRRDDFSIEGSFATGGAITAFLLYYNIHPLVTLLCAVTIGMIIGMMTCILHTYLNMNSIISGIVVTTGLFSCNLALIGSHVVVSSTNTIFTLISILDKMHIVVISWIVFVIVGVVYLFFQTELGYYVRAVGSNRQVLVTFGKNPIIYQMIGFALANSCAALAGNLLVQHVGFFSLMGSVGMLIVALSSLMLGNMICGESLYSVIIGSLMYQAIIVATIEFNIGPAWNKLITAVMIIGILALKRKK